MCMHMGVHTQMSLNACKGQKRELNPLELDLQKVLSCLPNVGLGIEFWSSARIASTSNHL